jgi:hypothetical protein
VALTAGDARELVHDDLLPALRRERQHLDVIDKWWRWEHEPPHQPEDSTGEYQELIRRSYTPWLGLVVTSVVQMLHVDGYRRPDRPDNLTGWRWWQANRMDSRQGPVHRAAVAYGHSYVTGLPGGMAEGEERVPVMRGVSPRRMVAGWLDPAADEWPLYALEAQPQRRGPMLEQHSVLWRLRLYDDHQVWPMEVAAEGGAPRMAGAPEVHGIGVCPVQRFSNQLDLEGRTPGEVEPFIGVAGRIDQTTFDRLVVQRFASWVVRTIAGMSLPESQESAQLEKLRMRAEDILIAEDPDTRFDSLPASDLSPFVASRDADIRDLAAVSQTPPHHLLGQMANLSAEALAAAESSLIRKVTERRQTFGESWESVLRLASRIAGDEEGWLDTSGQVQWRDMESRSMAQAADALGKLSAMGVPLEMLMEQIPGWTQQDVERARHLMEDGHLQALIDEIRAERQGSPAGSG